MKLSIIAPVYNTQSYVDDCIKSVVNQTFKDFEFILVDDGSTDRSGKMCDEWAEKDARIRVFHKANGGLMSAWKYGVARAKGEYIGFVDSDDWIDKNMFEVMVSTIEREKCDLVCTALQRNYEDGTVSLYPINLKEGLYDRSNIINDFFPKLFISREIHNRLIAPNRVTKIFKREKLIRISENCNDEVSIGEDLVATFNYLQICDSIYFIGDFYPYHYRINADSMIQKFDESKYEKIKKLRACLLDCNAKYGNYDFESQINADFVDLIIRNMEIHILSSNSKTIKNDILNAWLDPVVQQAEKNADARLLCTKNRLYLFLLRRKMVGTMIFIRRLKKVK